MQYPEDRLEIRSGPMHTFSSKKKKKYPSSPKYSLVINAFHIFVLSGKGVLLVNLVNLDDISRICDIRSDIYNQ